MRCERCGALQLNGDGYCRVCAAPLDRGGFARAVPAAAPRVTARGRFLTMVTLAAVAFLLLVCLTITALTLGLTSLIRWT